jgi:P-type Ca2+ transporter type 2C
MVNRENDTKVNHPAGLTSPEVFSRQEQYGKNIFYTESPRSFISIAFTILKEPMFLLLITACAIYFILGEISEGIMMLVAMCMVTAISLFQEVKTSNALQALKQLTDPRVVVIRDGSEIMITAEELVPGDIMMLSEGMKVPADAIILQSNDLTVNESIITGESLPAEKDEVHDDHRLFQGSTINSGKCIARATDTGNNTILGRSGKAVSAYEPAKTPLQLQINQFVDRLAFFGFIGFTAILIINYLHHSDWQTSVLLALTLAMSVIPEEIPVAFTSFMALGAFKMSKLGIITRQPQILENLGAVTVICLDKTGTVTQNKMEVKAIYDFDTDSIVELNTANPAASKSDVLRFALLASETDPFDEMEKAIQETYYLHVKKSSNNHLPMVHEFPLQGKPPMMTHVYKQGNSFLAATKGGAETILCVCRLDKQSISKVNRHVESLASNGYRVLGIASAAHPGLEIPAKQEDFQWTFEGLLALYDPPKKDIASVINQFHKAGIEVKLVSGDHPQTTMNIAGQIGIAGSGKCVTGDEVLKMKENELNETVKVNNVFARMFPDAKLKVIEALKANGEIVVMTGDGVNDGPALKCANIGIAMGQKGTGIARQAADLILTDDRIENIVTAIKEGRKIFSNLKKAVRYILAIHIPIILIASVPVIAGWTYPNIFTPIHVIFLELIMGPTCSVFFEREPVEENAIEQNPRERRSGLFSTEEVVITVTQGVTIAVGSLILYYVFMSNGASLGQTRSAVFTTVIISNLLLTFTNRSFAETMYYTRRYKNNLAPVIVITSILFLAVLHFIPSIRGLFQMDDISALQFVISFAVAFVSVMWFELYKSAFKKLDNRLVI